MRLRYLFAMAVFGLALLGVSTWAVFPLTGASKGFEPLTTNDLVDLTLESVHYLQALTTAVLGGAAALGSGTLTLGGAKTVPNQSLIFGSLLVLGLSLLSGFIAIELILETASEGILPSKLNALRWIRIYQSVALLSGVALVLASLHPSFLKPTR